VKSFASKFLLVLSAALAPLSGKAATYVEGGTALGSMKNAGNFFQTANVGSSNEGFIGSLSVYTPVTNENRFFHFELGLQGRVTVATDTNTSKSLDMLSPNLAVRLQVSRLYVGAGYAPIVFGSTDGIGHLRHITSAASDFIEGGIIWNLIPELQITANVGYEFGLPENSHVSPTISEYGLRFRFPINPHEGAAKGSSYDGFRYPFGVMK
jgi:hypothetical protein